ncbi:Annexin A7 [Thelohanellus kitauei]|uniref:Annexin A7 n=1 Tax=Thelohanellus kitauei TaxID=669202 RepID=A0A0C2ISI1_THEKT|nr:Annexin A7 [Thelohanellus kitauei]
MLILGPYSTPVFSPLSTHELSTPASDSPIQQMTSHYIPSFNPTLTISTIDIVDKIEILLNSSPIKTRSIYKILAHSTLHQSVDTQVEYETIFGKTLIDELKSRITGNERYFALSLLYSGSHLDAFIIDQALEPHVKSDILIHIFATRSHEQLFYVCQSYQICERDFIVSVWSRSFSETLELWDRKPRKNARFIREHDDAEARRQVEEMTKGPFSKISAPDTLIPIVARSSIPHLCYLSQLFERTYGESLIRFFGGYKGDYEAGLRSICEFMLDSNSYMARFLKKSITMGRIDLVMIIAVTRCQLDLGSIMTFYKSKYGGSPSQDIIKKFYQTDPTVVDGILRLMGLK